MNVEMSETLAVLGKMRDALLDLMAPAKHCESCKGAGGSGPFGANPICGDCGGSGVDERRRGAAYVVLAKADALLARSGVR